MKKIIMGLVLSLMMTVGMFAADWVKYGTLEGEEKTVDVYFDVDATKPFDIKNESIEYFLFLQDEYDEVEVWLGESEDWWLYNEAVECNCYAIRLEYKDFYFKIYIHDDDTVTVYSYRDIEEE